MWRAGFGRGFGPVVRQTAEWMNYSIIIYLRYCMVSSIDIIVKLPCKEKNGWKTVHLTLLTPSCGSANNSNSHPQGEFWQKGELYCSSMSLSIVLGKWCIVKVKIWMICIFYIKLTKIGLKLYNIFVKSIPLSSTRNFCYTWLWSVQGRRWHSIFDLCLTVHLQCRQCNKIKTNRCDK
jgi:hypothetical protein